MGLSSGKHVDARHCPAPGGEYDRGQAAARAWQAFCGWISGGLTALCILLLLALPAKGEGLRLATFGAALSRDGPGLLLRDILKGDDPQVLASVAVIVAIRPDILLLTDFDHDHDLVALRAFAAVLEEAGLRYPHLLSLPSNAGMATGLDINGNGRRGEAADGMGYGRFPGDSALALLSRYPFLNGDMRDFSDLLWRDLPGATLPRHPDGGAFPSEEVQAMLRLSSTGHWLVPVETGTDPPLTLLIWSATPPVFDGPEDMNGLRNRDELRLWQVVLDGGLGPPPESFVVMGNANLDPQDGDGLHEAMAAFLADPRLTDPRPASPGGLAVPDLGHRGDPALDTANWPESAGGLRVSYILPSTDWEVLDAGIFWPAPEALPVDPLTPGVAAAGAHRLVWVDIRAHAVIDGEPGFVTSGDPFTLDPGSGQ